MNRLALGTVQFGMDYGINNRRGKVPRSEAFEILESARRSGIDTIDTASSYGDSEEVVGGFIRSNNSMFKIISKLQACGYSGVRDIFESSLRKLGMSEMYGYLVHSFSSYKSDEKIWDELEDLRLSGKIKKIGFSLYSPDELRHLTDSRVRFDIVQLPYSVFDQRFEQYLPGLKRKGIEVHARSVFLQGLVFKKPDDLGKYFNKIRNKLLELNRLADELDTSIVSLCIGFAMANKYIDKIVVGVDSLQNFEEITKWDSKGFIEKETVRAISGLRIDDEDIVLPFKWESSRAKG